MASPNNSIAVKNDEEHWTQVAQQWLAWASSKNHDAFWAYRDALVKYLGQGTGKALEVGCGEGRVSREMRKLGYHVTATDAVSALVDAARHADSADEYAVAGANRLPFNDEQFDMVMAYNVLMDVDDLPGALKEVRRVMKRDGMLFISIVHPFRDRGRFAGPESDAAFIIDGSISYYGRQYFEVEEEHNGLRMHFAGWSQPFQNYMAAMEEVGLAITSVREPVPDETAGDSLRKWTRLPMFLWLKARLLQ